MTPTSQAQRRRKRVFMRRPKEVARDKTFLSPHAKREMERRRKRNGHRNGGAG